MENTRVTEEQKKQIMELKGQGVPVPEIAKRLGLSESGTYRVIQREKMRERVMELPLIDDSKEVQRLKEENESLKEQLRLLQKVIEKLIEK